MERMTHDAQERLRERAFTMWEEADMDSGLRYNMWHRLRPLLGRRDAPAHQTVAAEPAQTGKAKDNT